MPPRQGGQQMLAHIHLSISWQFSGQTANCTFLAQAQQHPAVAAGMCS